MFISPQGARVALWPTQPPVLWIPGDRSLGVKWPMQEADHSPPSSADGKNEWSYKPLLNAHAQGQLNLFLLQECTNTRCLVIQVTECCTVAPDIFSKISAGVVLFPPPPIYKNMSPVHSML
jgi:hypothetical protein